jgi:hypothetical protein
MFLSLDIPASWRADFVERYHGKASAQPATTGADIGTSD